MKIIAFLTFLIALLACMVIAASPAPANSQNRADSTKAFAVADSVLVRALAYLGLDSDRFISTRVTQSAVQRDTIQDDRTPFLHDRIVNRGVLRVHFDSVDVRSAAGTNHQASERQFRNFDVLLDPDSGELLKIYSTPRDTSPATPREAPVAVAESSVTDPALGLLSLPPPVTFLQAVSAAFGSRPYEAKEIVGLCVLSQVAGQTRTVWWIIGRGVPPLEVGTKTYAPQTLVCLRTVVDATTGEALYTTTTPISFVPRLSGDSAK